MSWRGSKGGIAAAKAGNTVIMAPNTHCYLDYRQTQQQEFGAAGTGEVPAHAAGLCARSLRTTAPDERKYILGVQGNLWTEYIPDFRQVKHMLLPSSGGDRRDGLGLRPQGFRGFQPTHAAVPQGLRSCGLQLRDLFLRRKGRIIPFLPQTDARWCAPCLRESRRRTIRAITEYRIAMKYLFCVLLALSLAACGKETEDPGVVARRVSGSLPAA